MKLDISQCYYSKNSWELSCVWVKIKLFLLACDSQNGIFWIWLVHSLKAFIINLHNGVTTASAIQPETCYLALLPLDLPSHDQNKEVTWSRTWLTVTQHGEHKHMILFACYGWKSRRPLCSDLLWYVQFREIHF